MKLLKYALSIALALMSPSILAMSALKAKQEQVGKIAAEAQAIIDTLNSGKNHWISQYQRIDVGDFYGFGGPKGQLDFIYGHVKGKIDTAKQAFEAFKTKYPFATSEIARIEKQLDDYIVDMQIQYDLKNEAITKAEDERKNASGKSQQKKEEPAKTDLGIDVDAQFNIHLQRWQERPGYKAAKNDTEKWRVIAHAFLTTMNNNDLEKNKLYARKVLALKGADVDTSDQNVKEFIKMLDECVKTGNWE